MSISNFYDKVGEHLEDALIAYSKKLAYKQFWNIHPWSTKALEGSVQYWEDGRMSYRVGVHVPTLLRYQWNVNQINYAPLEFDGHRQSPAIPFYRRVAESTYYGGYWWHVFPEHDSYTPITDALKDMQEFSYFYKKVK